MTGTTIDTDEQLVARAVDGDEEALSALLDRHLHPAWRIGLGVCMESSAAEPVVVDGVCAALRAAQLDPTSPLSLRTRIAAAVHAAALEAGPIERAADTEVEADPVLASYASLPIASRAAVWLTVVEGVEPASAAPVLGVSPGVAVAMARRATTMLRGRLGAGTHPVPVLRQLVTPVPPAVRLAIAARLAPTTTHDARPIVSRLNRRLVGAAAAAAVALGVTAGLLFGGGGSGGGLPELSSPSVDLSHLDDDADTAVTLAPLVLPVGGPIPLGPPAPSGSTAGRSPDAVERSRGTDPAPAPPSTTAAPPTTTAARPPTTTTSTSTTSTSTTSTTVMASNGGGGGSTPAATDPDDEPQATVEVPGLAAGAGDCTGVAVAGTAVVCDPTTGTPTVEVVVPGLPSISLLP